MIEMKNVTKKYKDKVALSNCNLQIPKGQVIGLFGANGNINRWYYYAQKINVQIDAVDEILMNAYNVAVEEGYRFGTYGDAMLIL